MIVCKRCGNHNAATNEFCDSCGVFLEWEGERIVEPVGHEPVRLLPPPPGLVTRIKHAVLGDGSSLPPPRHAGAMSSTLAPPETTVGQPTPQQPTTAAPRPKPHIVQPPTRSVNPGDLVCGTCGEVNGADRNFCRRCGTTLADVVPVRVRWWHRRRRGGAQTSPGLPAGQRPVDTTGGVSSAHAKGGKTRSARRGARKAKGAVLGGFGRVRRVLALLAIVGIGAGIAVPSLRSSIMEKADELLSSVKRSINPEYTQVSPDGSLSVASSAVAGHEATNVADGASNTFWVAAPDAAEAEVVVTFTPPTDLAQILITPGDQEDKANFKRQPRPKDLFVTVVDAAGAPLKTAQITLSDSAEPQKFGLGAGNAAAVEVTVQTCYPDPTLRVCPITELEFFAQK